MKWLVVAVLSGALAVSAPAQARPTIYQALLAGDEVDELSTFRQLMTEVFREEDLRRMFDGEHAFTIFAPTDAAFSALFDALSEKQRAAFDDLDSGALERLLRYHVTQGAWNKPTGALRMLDDNVAHTYRDDGADRINGAGIGSTTRYRNGLVAKISHVISPPSNPLPGQDTLPTSEHTNQLHFSGDRLTISDVVFGEVVITEGVPYTPPPTLGDNNLIIDAGRKKSEPPADFLKFDGKLSSDNMLSTDGSADEPQHLNFTVALDSLNVAVDGQSFSCTDVRLGQGHDALRINWWISQRGAFSYAPGDDDDEVYFFLQCAVVGDPLLLVDADSSRTFDLSACFPEDDCFPTFSPAVATTAAE